MKKRTKIYMRAGEVAELRLTSGAKRDSLYRLAQERDWDAYLASLEPVKPFPVTRRDVERLAAHFKG